MIAVLIALLVTSLSTQAEEVILRHSYAGNLSFELAGNTLRRNNNTCLAKSNGQSSGNINLPTGSVVKAAFLYWSGSGAVDSTAVINGQTVNADISYIESFQSRDYYSSKANVTPYISNSSSTRYTISGVTFDGSNIYCATEGAYGGWALTVIYENPNEPLRVINLFDGFKSFWGSQFSLIPNNFVIAQNPASKGGKHAHITWEGDEGNSQSRNSQTESLRFEGFNLTDANNPSNNQFNGYSNVTGRTSGVDIDEYNIGNFLTAGSTSVNTVYSSGQDAVFLTAELISVPNEPVADLSIQQTGPDQFIKGINNDVSLIVKNNGPNTASNNSQIIIPNITGLSLESFSGNNWSCTSNTSQISCLYQASINNNSSSDTLKLSLSAASNLANSFALTSTVTGILFDNILSNNTQSKTYSSISTNLSTSTKTVTDLNGGNVQPGDILRYKIDIKETNGVPASNVILTDNLDSNIASFEIVNLLSTINNNSLPSPAGSHNSGVISLSNINVAANATVSITIDAKIKSTVDSSGTINNTATLTSSGINNVSVSSPQVFVSRPISPSAGNKPLYLHKNDNLSRIKPTVQGYTTLADLANNTWAISPVFQQTFKFSGAQVNGYLFLQNDYSNGSWNHEITLSLLLNGSSIGSVKRTVTVPSRGVSGDNVGLFHFPITIPVGQTFNTGDTLSVKIDNNSEYDTDSLRIYFIDPNINSSDVVSPHSLISLPAETVINVDAINVLDKSTSLQVTETYRSNNLSIQATVSDPFGSFDITSSAISIRTPLGATIINQQDMSLLTDSGAAVKSFSFDFTLPADAPLGDWIITIVSKEGTENEIQHSSQFILKVIPRLPIINITKKIEVFSDPIHGLNSTNNFSKALPGSILTYTINARNTGKGVAENNSIWISDAIPDNTHMLVKDFNDISGQGPVIEEPINPNSGLTYQFTALNSNSDSLEFSNNNGVSFNYTPTADSQGIDKNVTHFRINPNGIFQAPLAGETANQFSIKFRVQLQ